MGLSIMHMKLKRPLVIGYEDYDSKFETTYCIKGHIAYNETGVIDTSLSQNQIGIYIKQGSRGMMMYPSGEEILAVSLIGQSGYLHRLPFQQESMDIRKKESVGLADALMKPRSLHVQYSDLFGQVAANSLDAALADSFYEGAAKMILSSLWQTYILDPMKGKDNSPMSSFERAALFDARDILTSAYMDPPKIPELAKQVSLNEYRLKQGFKEVFGKTIFEFSQELKMANAKSLLANREMSISQIAYEVGYLNVSHFARAFRKVYGMNPSDFRF